MKRRMNRRTFIKTGVSLGASSMIASSLFTRCGKSQPLLSEGEISHTISISQGSDYFENTLQAVDRLGGMKTFVHTNAKVAILANPQRNNPGTFTKPEILRAVIRMCHEAGAQEVTCISWLPKQNWENTGLLSVIEEEKGHLAITDYTDETGFRPTTVPNGKALTQARIMKTLFDYDVLIDVPIVKDHAGNKFTGTMKNLMGLNSPKTNRTFHKSDWKTNQDSIAYLDQCIADLNTVIHPDLCVVDATEFINTNGPFGPGDLVKPQKVVAGTDRVAIDTYCCDLLGVDPDDIYMIQKGYEHQLGEKDLGKIKQLENFVTSEIGG
jgi:uncharacterized protein (DUF362 family)